MQTTQGSACGRPKRTAHPAHDGLLCRAAAPTTGASQYASVHKHRRTRPPARDPVLSLQLSEPASVVASSAGPRSLVCVSPALRNAFVQKHIRPRLSESICCRDLGLLATLQVSVAAATTVAPACCSATVRTFTPPPASPAVFR